MRLLVILGQTYDSHVGEFVENKGISSIPKDSYMGGEHIEIDLIITASTSSNICYHLGVPLSASIIPVNKDDPFANYGTDGILWEVTENPQRCSVRTEKTIRIQDIWV